MLRPTYNQQVLSGIVEQHEDTVMMSDTGLTANDHAFRKSMLQGYDRGADGSGFHNSVMGVLYYDECYTCKSGDDYYDNPDKVMTKSYYLGLSGFALRDEHSRPLMIAGKPALEYAVWDHTDTLRDGSTSRNGHYAVKQLPYRFGYKKREKQEDRHGWVLIPISATTYKWLMPTMVTLAVILGMLWLNICFVIPIKVLYRISRGQIFSAQNHQQLQWSGRTWLLTPFVIVALQGLLALLHYRTITHDVQFVWWETLRSMSTCIMVGLVILLITQAFKRGLALQNEQALTI